MSRILIVVITLCLCGSLSVQAQVTGLSDWSIYIDPGHSRTENMGVFGYSEAEKNLRVGLELRDLLLEMTDIDTVYISRTNDTQIVSLSQRSDDANSVGAAWYHSIHSDAGAPTINRTLLLWGQLLSGIEKTPPGGQAMSNHMVDLLTRGMRLPSSGSLGDCGFYGSFIPNACSSGGPYLSVNRRTTMPSELSESGFHTNPVQNMRNMNPEWKALEARTLFWAILKYHGIDRPLERQVTGLVRDVETRQLLNDIVVSVDDSSYTTDGYESLFQQYSSDPEELRNGFYYFDDNVGVNPIVTVLADDYLPYDTMIVTVDSFFTFHDIELIPSALATVLSSSPEPDSVHRVIDDIVIDFSRIMDRASVENAFSIVPDVSGQLIWANRDFRLIFRPDSHFTPTTNYVVTVLDTALGIYGDVLDGDQNGSEGGDYSLSFETGVPDVVAPQLISSYPTVNQQGVDRNPIISVAYHEHIDPTSISSSLFLLEPTVGGNSIPGRHEYYEVAEKGVISFFTEDRLDPDLFYRFSIFEGIADIFGNTESGEKSVTFRTGSLLYDHVPIDDFDNDLAAWWVPQQSGSTIGIVTDSTHRSSDSVVVNLQTESVSSMRIDYGWDVSEDSWMIRTFLGNAATPITFDSTYSVQAYVFGDGSGNLFRFAIDDNYPNVSSSNHEVSPWYTIDWYGWRLISWLPSRDGVGSWLGDGIVDGDTRFDSIQLSHVQGASEFGRIFIDDLRVATTASSTRVDPGPEFPTSLVLHQNYPNPFRGSTTLTFDLPEPGPARLEIFNLLGESVATPFEAANAPSGRFEIEWVTSALSSGVYLARLTKGGEESTIRMVVLN